jgi:hypothetical protein
VAWLRLTVLVLSTLAFVRFAARDMRLHKRGRPITSGEHAIHGLLGLAQLALFVGAFVASSALFVGGTLATAVLGAGDEYAFHRGIPGEESDLHAKAHWALFIFIAAALLLPGGRLGH